MTTTSARPRMTDREVAELLTMLASGLSSRQVARRLGIGVNALGMRLQRLRDARGCRSTVQLVAEAVRDGEVTWPRS